jgi:hypothetical protein
MGANRPSVEALKPDHRTWKFMPHVTSQEEKAGKEVWKEGSTRDRISRKENQKNSEKYNES